MARFGITLTLSQRTGLVLCGALVAALAYLWITPPLAAPDEGAHLAYPRHILVEHELPTYTRTSDDWENHQPPLYYLLSLPFVLTGRTLPIFDQVLLNRLASVFMYVLCVWVIAHLLRRLLPRSITGQMAGLLVMLLPMVVNAGATYNNDILGCLIIALLWLAGWRYRDQPTRSRLVLFSIALGLVGLTKVVAFPAAVALTVWTLWRRPWRNWLSAAVISLAICGWWFVQNIVRVGDLLGLKYTDIFWAGQHENIWSGHGLTLLFGKLVTSFIAALGKSDILLPWAWYILTWSALGALMWRYIKHKPRSPHWLLILTGISLTLIGVIALNNRFFQPQGRYLIPLIPFLAAMVGYGISTLSRCREVVLCMAGFLIAMNIAALSLVQQQVVAHPSPLIQYPRHINVLPMMATDNPRQSTFVDGQLVIQPNAKFFVNGSYTDTTQHPQLVLTTLDGAAYSVRVEWRVPGQSWFDDRRIKTVMGTGTTTVIDITEVVPSAIESFRLTFIANQPITVTGADWRAGYGS